MDEILQQLLDEVRISLHEVVTTPLDSVVTSEASELLLSLESLEDTDEGDVKSTLRSIAIFFMHYPTPARLALAAKVAVWI